MSSLSSDSASSTSKLSPTVQEKEITHGKAELVEPPLQSPIAQDLKRWPQNPLPVHYTRSIELALDLYDVMLVAIPILMIIKAVLCVIAAKNDLADKHFGLHIEYASDMTKKLVEVNKQMTTIFTIFFIVIIGTTFKRLALWKAQRGAKLSELEILQASVSPTSTLRMIASLRVFTFSSLFVAFIWVFYYIGSQAAVYELSLRDSFAYKSYPIALLGTEALTPFEDGTWSEYTAIQKTDSNSLFHVYAQKVKGTYGGIISTDIVSNALPLLFTEDMAKPGVKKDNNGFTLIPETGDYSIVSAIGSHFYVNEILDAQDPNYNHGWHQQRMLGEYAFNASYIWIQCSQLALSPSLPPSGLMPTFTMSLNMTNSTDTPSEKRSFDFWNTYNSTHAFTATCGIQQLNQEVNVKCDPKACKVNKIRSRPGFANPSNDTLLFHDDVNAQAFFDSMLYACGRPVNTSDTSTFEADNGLAKWKAGLATGTYSLDAFTDDLASDAKDNVHKAEKDLSFAMTKYMNTYLEASRHLKYEHGFGIQELTSEDRNITIDNALNTWDIQTMFGAEFEPNYAISWPWIVVDIVSSGVLLVAAVVAFWLRKTTHAPDIFGYVSSLTRDNVYLDVPGGSALGGVDRTRMMKHVSVKLGEVPTGSGVGRITLTYVGEDDHCAKDLEKAKVYL